MNDMICSTLVMELPLLMNKMKFNMHTMLQIMILKSNKDEMVGEDVHDCDLFGDGDVLNSMTAEVMRMT